MSGKSTGEKCPLATRVMIQALNDQGYSMNAIAKKLQISAHTVKAVLMRDVDAIEQRAAARLKEALPAAMRLSAAKLVDHLANPDVIAKASLRDATVSMGILIDKARLEGGETTSNQSFILQVQAQADRNYIEALKASAQPAQVVEPVATPALPEPVESIEVQACPTKEKKSCAPSKKKKTTHGKAHQKRD